MDGEMRSVKLANSELRQESHWDEFLRLLLYVRTTVVEEKDAQMMCWTAELRAAHLYRSRNMQSNLASNRWTCGKVERVEHKGRWAHR